MNRHVNHFRTELQTAHFTLARPGATARASKTIEIKTKNIIQRNKASKGRQAKA
jgi:hypothetical protein